MSASSRAHWQVDKKHGLKSQCNNRQRLVRYSLVSAHKAVLAAVAR